MEIKNFSELKKFFKDNNFDNLALLIHGSEKQLINDSTNFLYSIIKDLPQINISILEGDAINYDDIVNACETIPMMSDKRIVHIKNPSFLKKISGGDNDNTKKLNNSASEDIIKYLSELIKSMTPGLILYISYEGEVDLRSKIISVIKNTGLVLEYKPLKGEDLNKYVANIFEKNRKKINKSDLLYFLSGLGNSIEQIEKEVEKLCVYNLEDEMVTREIIDRVVHKNMENNIFKMADSISKKEPDNAISILNTLLFQKEEPLRILAMIIRQFRLLYMVKLKMDKRSSIDEIKAYVKLGDYAVNNFIKQARNFSDQNLVQSLGQCFDTDYDIKVGKLSPELALETLIIKLCK